MERENKMRVFISWSGERSHVVASALKSFIGDIIQSVTPFVSDEDVISGERWTNRIQDELQENQFGVLSITNDNKESPWLLFEAGALSNSTNSIPVVPFLFDIEPSELTGSPLLQFQATIYYNNKENVIKLINDINDACGDGKLDNVRLERAFDRCYPEFESALKKVKPELNKPQNAESDKTHVILEELLDLTRNNQKLLSNDNMNISLERVGSLLEDLYMQMSKNGNIVVYPRRKNKFVIEELYHYCRKESFGGYNLLIVLSLFRDDFPWLYDAGKDLLDIMKSKDSLELKQRAKSNFLNLIEFTSHSPIPSISNNKELYMMLHELPMMLSEFFDFDMSDNQEKVDRRRVLEDTRQRNIKLHINNNLSDE
jgi:hypothetical protein